MNKKLYVGNLPFTAEEQMLHAHFGADGRQVTSVKIMIDRETGRSRGFAFIEMATPEDAEKAIAVLHGSDFMGRPLTVNEAREQAPRGAGGGFGGPRPGGGAPGGFSGPRPGAFSGPRPNSGGAPGGFSGPRPGGFSSPRPSGGGGFGGGNSAPFGGEAPPANEGPSGRGARRERTKGKDKDRRGGRGGDDW